MVAEFEDGSIVVEWTFKGEGFLIKGVLGEAGDAVVLEPADLRETVLQAAERLLVPVSRRASQIDAHRGRRRSRLLRRGARRHLRDDSAATAGRT